MTNAAFPGPLLYLALTLILVACLRDSRPLVPGGVTCAVTQIGILLLPPAFPGSDYHQISGHL